MISGTPPPFRILFLAPALLASALLAAGCSSDASSDAGETVLTVSDAGSSPTTTPTESTNGTSGEPTSTALSTDPNAPDAAAPIVAITGNVTVEVVASLPHDPLAYTQGLEWHDGWLYESTGEYGASDLRRIDPETGDVDLLVPLSDSVFGEGLTIVGDEILQLSWREGELLRSGIHDLEPNATQRYDGEGWGLCNDGNRLVMSDGSSTLTMRDPITFEIVATLAVTANGAPLDRLNELECVGGQIIANVYGLDQIVAIDATTGIVVGVVDAAVLRPDGLSADDFDLVLNGMAYQPETGHWFLTGKYWPVLYEVEIVAG